VVKLLELVLNYSMVTQTLGLAGGKARRVRFGGPKQASRNAAAGPTKGLPEGF
jgi:hypothetical protein